MYDCKTEFECIAPLPVSVAPTLTHKIILVVLWPAVNIEPPTENASFSSTQFQTNCNSNF